LLSERLQVIIRDRVPYEKPQCSETDHVLDVLGFLQKYLPGRIQVIPDFVLSLTDYPHADQVNAYDGGY
jgi:hypothetical protein